MMFNRSSAFRFLIFVLMSLNLWGCKTPQEAINSNGAQLVKNGAYFLFLSDIHLDASRHKTDSTQDTGLDLWQNCTIKLDSILNSPDPPKFVMCTGDLPAHYKCITGCFLTGEKLAAHNKNIMTVLSDLRKLVAKNGIPLFYIPGNNDPIAGDYYSFANQNKQTLFSLVDESILAFPALNVSTKKLATHIISMPDTTMGYYSALIINGLRVIALNSNIFAKKYHSVDGISQIKAGNTEMNWLSEQLKDAQSKGEKVYIAMHIPPGKDWALLPSKKNLWLNSFLSLSDKYQSTIVGIFYGHTHMDELRLLYDSTGEKMTQVAISCPGITPIHGNNPAFKLVSFDPQSLKPINFTTYYSSVSAASWGNKTYQFSTVFHTDPKKAMYESLKTMSISEINKDMNLIYTVRHGKPNYHGKPYNTMNTMIVKWK